jgi:hypothetical protein
VFSRSLPLVLALALPGCVEALELPAPVAAGEQAVGETRTVELRFLRLDVKNVEQTIDLAKLKTLPRKTLDDLWLVDFDLTPSVKLVLEELSNLSAAEAEELSPAAQNMRKLLNMTPDNVRLEGTKLEKLISLAGSVGIPPAKCLANLLAIGVTERAIPYDIVADVFLRDLLGTHPNTQFRPGPVDDEHPDGKYPIAPKSLPITLGDIVYNFENLPTRFGPTGDHPGFVVSAAGVVGDDFKMIVRASLNALPYKGVDLTSGYVASVNSAGSQIATIFDFDDPDSMRLEGLKDTLEIAEMTVRIRENKAFQPGGDAMEPLRQGNSPAWDLPPWEFEHLIMEMGRTRTLGGDPDAIETPPIPPHCNEYDLGTGVTAFSSCIDADGWTVLETFTDVGEPPPPAYLWDILAEVAQVRLHDPASPGDPPIPEGEADVEITLKDIAVPVDQDDLLAQARANFAADPEALADLTELLVDNSDGDADFYYYRVAAEDADYLFFVTEDDLRKDDAGELVRPYAYARPGFFADAALKQKLSDTAEVDGDVSHEKVRVTPGQTLFIEDDAGRVYQIVVGPKPAASTLSLDLTRVR